MRIRVFLLCRKRDIMVNNNTVLLYCADIDCTQSDSCIPGFIDRISFRQNNVRDGSYNLLRAQTWPVTVQYSSQCKLGLGPQVVLASSGCKAGRKTPDSRSLAGFNLSASYLVKHQCLPQTIQTKMMDQTSLDPNILAVWMESAQGLALLMPFTFNCICF